MICCGANEIPECATSALVGHHACREDAHQSILVTRRLANCLHALPTGSINAKASGRMLIQRITDTASRTRTGYISFPRD